MSVILEFSVNADQFSLGSVLADTPDLSAEIERIVPVGGSLMPYFWVTGENFHQLEENLLNSDLVQDFVALDRLDGSALYRVEWKQTHEGLIRGIVETDAVLLNVRGGRNWSFRLRFPDHDAVGVFYNYCTEHDIEIHVDRVYTLTEDTRKSMAFDLSPEQREALVLALRRGYFKTPSEASLGELAEELGISQQALSKRIRRGNLKVLQKVLLSSAEDLPQ